MAQVEPWAGLPALIVPFYPKAGNARQPYPLETMLRFHLLQNWFVLSDPAMEEAPYEIALLRQFVQLSLIQGSIPEDTTIMNFRHWQEKHGLAAEAHIGADAESGLVHSVAGTATNVADVTQVDRLLHGEENASVPMWDPPG